MRGGREVPAAPYCFYGGEMGAGWHTPESLCALYHLGYLGRGLWDDPIFRYRLYHALLD